MAGKKKVVKKRKEAGKPIAYLNFIDQLLKGELKASKLYDDVVDANGNPDFDYEDNS